MMFSTKILSYFSTSAIEKVTIAALFTIVKREGESIKSHLTRFNELSVHLEDSIPVVCVDSLNNGLWEGPFNGILTRHLA